MYQKVDDFELLTPDPFERKEFEEVRKEKRWFHVLAVTCLIAFSVVAFSGNINISTFSSSSLFRSSSSCSSISLQASNEYGVFTAPYPYLENGELLIEPYKTTTVVARIAGIDNLDTTGFILKWKIGSNEYEGPTISVVLTTTGTFDVSIDVYEKGAYVCTYYSTAYVKYVKRELRSLTADDRNKVLDAAVQMWKYSDKEGQALYGSNFISMQTFVEEHALASNDIMCDEYHEGTGFVTHHLAAGIAFESSLRAIDPSVTTHYWDFTIEGEEILASGGKPSDSLSIVPFYSEDWFGSVDSDHHVADGRWAHTLMPVAPDSSSTHNSYGYIRSYWNNNPDPEISRALFSTCGVEPVHKAVPTCASHYDILNANDLATIQVLSPSDGHGPMHVQTGGVWGGCTEAYQTLITKWDEVLNTEVTDEEIVAGGYDTTKFRRKWGETGARKTMLDTAVMGEYFHIYRSLWRSHMCAADALPGYLECPDSCSADTPFEECSCSVPKLMDGTTTRDNLLSCVLNTDNEAYFRAVFPDEFLTDLVLFTTQSSVLEGEMVESASTADPIFWFIHPVIERLLQAKRLPGVTDMGGFEFSKWDTVDGSDQEFYEYSYYSFEEGAMSWYNGSYTCPGHAANDRALPAALHLTDIFNTNNADADGDGIITNTEFYLALNPNDPSLNDYVFDNFKWDHCGSGYFD